jgi:hypothetical protein
VLLPGGEEGVALVVCRVGDDESGRDELGEPALHALRLHGVAERKARRTDHPRVCLEPAEVIGDGHEPPEETLTVAG